MIEQPEIHRKSLSKKVEERKEAAEDLRYNFAILPEEHKQQAWEDLHWLTQDGNDDVRWGAASALGSAYSSILDKLKQQAWEDLHWLTQDENYYVRGGAAYTLGSAFSHIPEENKQQAWEDLIRLTQDGNDDVRGGAASALGSAYSSILDKLKQQAWEDLHWLTSDNDDEVRASAYHSLGKASIFRATIAKNHNKFKKLMEEAIGYFEESAQQEAWSEPAKFCLPFYRSFYTLTFMKEEAEAEVQRYIAEAKSAVGGSESKEKLLEAVENLSDALKEAQKAKTLGDKQYYLNVCRKYCERTTESLNSIGDKAPVAKRAVERGLPIISGRIKEIIGEIQEKGKKIYKQVKGTENEELGKETCSIIKQLKEVEDPILLDINESDVLTKLSAVCGRYLVYTIDEAMNLIKEAKKEGTPELTLGKISKVLDCILTERTIMRNINAKNSIIQIVNGNKNNPSITINPIQESNKTSVKRLKKKRNAERATLPYPDIFFAELSDMFSSLYQKDVKPESEKRSKTLECLKRILHELTKNDMEVHWLDVGFGNGRCLYVLDDILKREKIRYHGIDILYKHWHEADVLARKYNLIPEFKKMDATAMNCNSKYDIVSAVLFLHEVDPLCLPYILRNMLNALNDKGKLVISDFEGPYEQESGVVIWNADDIKYLLRNIGIDNAMMKFENIKADIFPNELGFYRCYVNKMAIDNEKLDKFMQGYGTFLAKKKEDSENMRDELRSQTKKRVCEILGRDNVDNKNMSDKEKKLIEKKIEPEYGIKTLKARLFTSHIEFLDRKMRELNSGTPCHGARQP